MNTGLVGFFGFCPERLDLTIPEVPSKPVFCEFSATGLRIREPCSAVKARTALPTAGLPASAVILKEMAGYGSTQQVRQVI